MSLIEAIEKNNLKLVKELLENDNPENANILINTKNKTGWSPLFCACYKGNFEIIKYLCNYDNNINEKNTNDNTVLHAVGDNIEILNFLYEKFTNIDIDAETTNGWTPLHCACYHGTYFLL